MRHVPHVYVPPPWDREELAVTIPQRDHLERVLRLVSGSTISYTDGEGVRATGVYESGVVVRGQEVSVPRPSELIMATPPPGHRDRARFLVEKLGELGIPELVWLKTEYGNRRPPSLKKVRSWAVSALEQSRGSWLMSVDDSIHGWDRLQTPVAVAVQGGVSLGQSPIEPRPRTVVVGPEGGFAKDEVPGDLQRLDLGPTVLRMETAAIFVAAHLR